MNATRRPKHNRDGRRPLLKIAAAVIIGAASAASAADVARASARTGVAFKVVARNQDELGVWHVTALLPQLVAKEGKATMETGSVLAQIDCRQRVLRIDAWSVRVPSADEPVGWRPPAGAPEQALLKSVCDRAPVLQGRTHALTSSPAADVAAAPAFPASSVASIGDPQAPRPRFAAQIGLFTSKAAADRALAQAKARLADASGVTPLAVPAPGTTSTFRALLATATVAAARAVCVEERRSAAQSTCWIRPINP